MRATHLSSLCRDLKGAQPKLGARGASGRTTAFSHVKDMDNSDISYNKVTRANAIDMRMKELIYEKDSVSCDKDTL